MELDFEKLSIEELEQVLSRTPIDIQARIKAKAEIERRRKGKGYWSWGVIWPAISAVAAILAILAMIFIPEIRKAARLERTPPPPIRQTVIEPTPTAADVNSLQGIWADSSLSTSGGQQFFEFQPGGSVGIRLNSITSNPITSNTWNWFLAGDTLHVVIRISGPPVTAYVHEGRLVGNAVEGTWWEVGSEKKFPWHLDRAYVSQPVANNKKAQKPEIKAIPGVWVDPNFEFNGKPVFVRFLSNGRVELRDSLTDTPAIPPFVNWYRVNQEIHLIWEKDGKVAQKWDLAMKDGMLKGTLTTTDGGQIAPMKLVRTDSQ